MVTSFYETVDSKSGFIVSSKITIFDGRIFKVFFSPCHIVFSIAIIHVVLMCRKHRRICVASPLWHGMQDCIVLLDLGYDLAIVRVHQGSKYTYFFVGSITQESDTAVVNLQLSSSTFSLAYFLGTL